MATNISAYDLAVSEGFKGTLTEWLESLNGSSAFTLALKQGYKGSIDKWLQSLQGKSAYTIAVEQGFNGSLKDWYREVLDLKSLTTRSEKSLVKTLELSQEISNKVQEAVELIDISLLVDKGISLFRTESQLLAAQPLTDGYYKVVDTGDIWIAEEGVPIKTGFNPVALAKTYTDQTLININNVIRQSDRDGYVDKYGFFISLFTFTESGVQFQNKINVPAVKAKIIEADQLKIQESEFSVVDKYGFRFNFAQNTPKATKMDLSDILLVNKMWNWSDNPFQINVAHTLLDRQTQIEQQPVIAAFSSNDREFLGKSDEMLYLPKTEDIEGTVDIVFRNKVDFYNRTRLVTTFKSVPASKTKEEIKILVIGDSNTSRGATAILKFMLERKGYIPKFIGTFTSTDDTYGGVNLPSQLGETRGGIGVPSLTHMNLTWKPVDDAGAALGTAITVAKYKALANDTRTNYNPMLRLANSSDDPTVVKNGYVLDFADYLNKFNLETPDVVFFSMAGNQVNKLGDEMLPVFYEGFETFLKQVRKGLPNAKILVGHNSPAYHTTRDGSYWSSFIVKQFQAKRELCATYGATLLNTHVIDIGEASYAISKTNINEYGLETGYYTDGTHYKKALRFKLFDYVAANIAAAKLNLI